MIDKLQAHYGFTRMPFGRDLAPGMLHRHAAHNEACARITWCIAERAIGVITGEVLGVAALDGVLDVPARHSGAGLVSDAGLEVIGPGQAVVADSPQAGGQVRNELHASGAGRGFVRHQRPAVEPEEIPDLRVVGVTGVGRVGHGSVVEDDGPALVAGRIDYGVECGVVFPGYFPGTCWLPVQAAIARSTVAPAAVSGIALLRFIEPPARRG